MGVMRQAQEKGDILVVSADSASRREIEALLAGKGYRVGCAAEAQAALMLARNAPPDLAVIDICLPDQNGYDVCRHLKEDPETFDTAVVLMSTGKVNIDILKVYCAGANDFITRPLQSEMLLASIETNLDRQRRIKHFNLSGKMQTAPSKKTGKKKSDSMLDILEQQHQFQLLLIEISTQFINMPIEKIDRAILNSQRRICDFFKLDLSSLWQWSPREPGFTTLTHAYRPYGGLPVQESMDTKEFFPWSNKQLMAGKTVAVPSVDRLPAEAAIDRETLQYLKIKSSITFPLSIEGEPIFGILAFDTIFEENPWSESLVNSLKLVSQIFTNALVRKRYDENLKLSRERMQLMADAAKVAMWSVNIPTDEIWVSPVLLELSGFDPDAKPTTDTLFNLIHVDDRENIKRSVNHAIKSGGGLDADCRIILPDGSIRWIAIRGHRRLNDKQEPEALMGVFLDITERMKTREFLRKSEEKYRRLHESMMDGFVFVDMKGFIREFNETYLKMTGYAPDELQHMNYRDLTPEKWYELEDTIVREQILARGYSEIYEKEYRRKDGIVFPIELRTVLLKDETGENSGMWAIIRDITERKKTETLLQQNEERFRMALEANSEGVWDTNIQSGETFFSPGYAAMLGYTPEEFAKNHSDWKKLVHPDDYERISHARNIHITEGKHFCEEFRIRKKSGDWCWVLSRGMVIERDPEGRSIRMVGTHLDITDRKKMETELKEHIQEIERLKKNLERENIYLQEEIKFLGDHREIIGTSHAIKEVILQAAQVAPTDSTVLILGETGTGKELLARAIHQMSRRKDRTLITVNCASLPPTLIESELFGREKGAYTGALTKMIGRFEIADGSTLFLDEIGELPIEMQSKLLRILEQGVFERLGSSKNLKVDVRVIAATNRDLQKEVSAGTFRKDLYYRLNVFPISIPPLRDRREDIPLLVWAFVKEFQEKMGKRIKSIPKREIEALKSYSWPGNVRELKNVIERAFILSASHILNIEIPSISPSNQPLPAECCLEDAERNFILSALEKTSWRISGKGGAAEILKIRRTTLQAKMKKLGIRRPNSP